MQSPGEHGTLKEWPADCCYNTHWTMWFVCTPVKCQNQLEMSTLIYVFGHIANIASRFGVYIFRMWYNLLPWFSMQVLQWANFEWQHGIIFLYHLLTGCNLSARGPNPFLSSMSANSIFFSRNMFIKHK